MMGPPPGGGPIVLSHDLIFQQNRLIFCSNFEDSTRMSAFPNRNDHPSEVPAWASFFEADEYAAFETTIHGYFQSLGKPFKVDDGTVRTTWMVNDSNMQNLGLLNVAQMCKQGKIQDYPEIVRNHFEVMRKSQDFISGFLDNMGDFEFVKPFIGTRLYHKDHVKSIGAEGVISSPVTEDIIAMLVFDMPQAISSVKADQTRVWGKNVEELLALGLHNIRENYDFTITDLDANVTLKAVLQDHFFGTNIILDMNRHPELLGTHGTLVAVPHRHTTLFHPIEDTSVILAINMLIPMVYGMHHEGPGSISSHLYWHHQGTFVHLPYRIEHQQLAFHPPSDFVSMLNYLATETK